MSDEWYKAVLSQSANIKVTGVLAPLFKLILVLLAATTSVAILTELTWLIIVLASMSGLSFFVYLGAFAWLIFTDRNALRSEEYTLKDKIIQTIGDNSKTLSPTAIKALSQISTNPIFPPINGEVSDITPIEDISKLSGE